LPPEAKAKYDAAKKEYDAAYAPYRVAAKANNKEEAARLRPNVDALYAKMQQVQEDHRRAMLPKSSALSDQRYQINRQMAEKYEDPVAITIAVNHGNRKLEGKGWTLGTAMKPGVKVHRVIYQLSGPDAAADLFMSKVDQTKLKALLAVQ
jgi:hypothetical protein